MLTLKPDCEVAYKLIIALRLAALLFGVMVCVGWGVFLLRCLGATGRMVINGGKLDHELEDDRMNTFANVDLYNDTL